MPVPVRAPKPSLSAREEVRMSKAVAEILQKDVLNSLLPMGQRITFRSVSIKYKVTIGTLFSRVEIAKNPPAIASKRRGPPNFLTDAEERSIVELMLRRADKGHPQFKSDLQDVAAMIVKMMPVRRRSACPFRDGRPGDKLTSRFIKRHAEMHLGRVSKNQKIRFRHCNGEALTTHLASIHDIIKTKNILPSNIANLDEAGCTPGKDVKGDTNRKVLTRHGCQQEAREPEFNRSCTRVTLMPCIFADGTYSAPLFVFKGETGMRRRTVETSSGQSREELIIDRLPVGAIVSYNSQVAGVDG
eukprot:IDg6118t1